MKHLRAAAVCYAVLYGLDAYWFHGWFFTKIQEVGLLKPREPCARQAIRISVVTA